MTVPDYPIYHYRSLTPWFSLLSLATGIWFAMFGGWFDLVGCLVAAHLAQNAYCEDRW